MYRPMSAQTRNENLMRASATRRLARATDPVEKLRLLCLQRGSSGILGLGRVFRRMDDNGNGVLSFEEFKKGLHDSGFDRSMDDFEMEELFQMFDRDNSGAISYDEFLRAIRPKMSQNRLKIVEKAFSKLDRTGDGVVTYHDLKDVYNVMYHPFYQNGQLTEKELFLRFLANFEVGGNPDGIVTKEEFIDYYTGVSASIDEDAYFDLMVRLAWKL
ncbi:calcyphosin-like protein [Argiope bruennichi]|uniref:Calcyphosin-like protein like n=1 Tax=Argiope bruennichi TaxID=94029 RepID=A0A8T0F3E6_ARGBR|nr:calcyphosin-like protein [Argiope bruennichi]XP_055927354.1 calcyphosin-like protein [Argiope bruennichi]XP_055927355.1 calcyphosin-like protein [Argiope bruennichi]KAF8785361.1 Calcyphosin-like protein like [Argiope bruennichi]